LKLGDFKKIVPGTIDVIKAIIMPKRGGRGVVTDKEA